MFQIESHHADQLRNQQLILYETLLRSHHAPTLLSHQPFLRPLLELLNQFDNANQADGPAAGNNADRNGGKLRRSQSSDETEFHLVVLINQLCVRLMENLELLDFFFQVRERTRRFFIFT